MDNTVFKKRGNVVTSESKTDGRQTNGKGCQRGRKVSGAAWGREGRVWWAPNEQIMTGSILQDGVTVPPTPPLSTPPSSPALLLSSLLSLTVQFPPLASLLLPANCEWSLIIGPPTRLRSELSQRLREETGMSKCYRRQQTARGTLRPNVHPKTHQRLRCPSEETHMRRPSWGIQKPARRLSNYILCQISLWSFCERSPHASDGFLWLQRGVTVHPIWDGSMKPHWFSCFWKMPDSRYVGVLLGKTHT